MSTPAHFDAALCNASRAGLKRHIANPPSGVANIPWCGRATSWPGVSGSPFGAAAHHHHSQRVAYSSQDHLKLARRTVPRSGFGNDAETAGGAVYAPGKAELQVEYISLTPC